MHSVQIFLKLLYAGTTRERTLYVRTLKSAGSPLPCLNLILFMAIIKFTAKYSKGDTCYVLHVQYMGSFPRKGT